MIDNNFLPHALTEFKKSKELAERAFAQLDDMQFFKSPDNSVSNSVALTVKHLAGNMRSRWTDFLTTDGEKADRNRDTEFELIDDTRASLMTKWESSWKILFDTLNSLSEDDLSKTITIRGESHTVTQAIFRQLTHYAYHVGQIVYTARNLVGSNWKTLSVAKGKSKEFEKLTRDKHRNTKGNHSK